MIQGQQFSEVWQFQIVFAIKQLSKILPLVDISGLSNENVQPAHYYYSLYSYYCLLTPVFSSMLC